ncbi:heterokaryon incompatibility protein-domain-containing protein [Cercophora samala]|uniref:Heterokaryon incompatibility protein-domain-containing protein n=1 Tax=Cercophora samala TaxID=330535 RepID=A0AA39ZDR4_9PEZI|nr:heterokaryon incompatibility protein-domain-containing protein [Cercophora samala]
MSLDKTWTYHIDNHFATDFLTTSHPNFSSLFPPAPQTQQLCRRCRQLDYSAGAIVWRERLSEIQETSRTCQLHKILHKALTTAPRNPVDTIEVQRRGTNFYVKGESSPALSICQSLPQSQSGTKDELPTVPPSTNSKHVDNIQVGYPLLPEIASPIYFSLMNLWLQQCDKSHPQCHKDPPALITRPPTRLVDISPSKVRLVLTADLAREQIRDLRYLALSHPWGSNPPNDHFCTDWNNIGSRMDPGLDPSVLPKTFRDAIKVTLALGHRYLWIDSLCIVQGEDGDFQEEAKYMEAVFSQAYCVIAASRATGTSSGFLQPRPPRDFVTLEYAAGRQLYVCEAIDDFQEDVIDGPLNKRGWVLQERALARRTIYFTEAQTYWECGAGIHCETLTKMTNRRASFLGDPNFPQVAIQSTRGDKIRLYESLYQMYSRLQFTKIWDRPIAIAGLEQRLVAAFNTHGGYGVFDSPFFGRSLLWQRDESAGTSMTRIHFPREQRYNVPSWSWMAYEGAISFMDLPFDGIDWLYSAEGLVPPWGSTTYTTTASSHTGNTDEHTFLRARVRDFTDLMTGSTGIIYDAGSQYFLQEKKRAKCVVVGKQKSKSGTTNVHHYVIVVVPKDGKDGYERVGVAALPGNYIRQGGEGEITMIF